MATLSPQEELLRKSAKVALSILATVAVGACSDHNSSETAVQKDCVDNRSSAVVSPDWCTPGHPNYLPVYAWYYGGMMYRSGNTSYMRGGSFTAPARGSRSFSRSSPTVNRGVIGGSTAGKAGG